MSDAATLAWYAANAAHFAGAFHGPSRHLDGFLDRLDPGARILELGCGAGRDAAQMAARGFAVDPTDATPALVAIARDRCGLPARVMRFDQLDVVAAYDAVWAHACLLHVARADLPRVLAAIRRALRPGGWHYASYKLGAGEGRDPLGRYTNFATAEWLNGAYREADMIICESMTYRGEGADGVVRDWQALIVRRD